MLLQQAGYVIRKYRQEDFKGLLKLYRETEISERSGLYPSSAQLQERFRDPQFSPEEDMLVVENKKNPGEIAALLEMAPEKAIKRVVLSGLVHPLHRRKKLASRFVEQACRQAAGQGAHVAHVNVARFNRAGQEVLSRLGFSPVRSFWELRARTGWVCPEGAGPEIQDAAGSSLSLRSLQPGEEALLARLQNRCFTGTWGYNPNTVEDICYQTSLEGSSMGDVVVLFQGEDPVAYCWNRTDPRGQKGRIHMLGVVPEQRGNGLAGAVLQAGVFSLCQQGKNVVELTTDCSNTPACRLYFSSGFRVWSETLWFERSLA